MTLKTQPVLSANGIVAAVLVVDLSAMRDELYFLHKAQTK